MKSWKCYFDRPQPRPVQKVNGLAIENCTKNELGEEIRRLTTERNQLLSRLSALRDIINN